jgi:plastocyanin
LKRSLAVLALTCTATAPAVAVPALGASAAKTHTATVKVEDDMFVKDKLTVARGTRVVWKWTHGTQPHNVTVDSGPSSFHSKTQSKGSFARTLTKPGTYRIVCTIHEAIGMTMTLVVKR